LLLLPMPSLRPLLLFRLRSLVLTLLRPPWVPEPPLPGRLPLLGRLWLPPLIEGFELEPELGRWRLLPPDGRFEVLADGRLELPELRPPP
jgi:hypothetical protein